MYIYIYIYIYTVPSISIGTVKTKLLCWLWSQDICKYDYKMNMRQNYSMSNFIISRFNTYMFYQIKRTALLESIPLIDVSIHIGVFENKADIKYQKLLISCRSLAYNHSSKSMTRFHPLKYFPQPLMQPIPIVACFGEFLPLLYSSAGEIHFQSDLKLEIDLGNLGLSIYLPL